MRQTFKNSVRAQTQHLADPCRPAPGYILLARATNNSAFVSITVKTASSGQLSQWIRIAVKRQQPPTVNQLAHTMLAIILSLILYITPTLHCIRQFSDHRQHVQP